MRMVGYFVGIVCLLFIGAIMPFALYPICWRGRYDCEPIHCIDGTDGEYTEDQIMSFDYKPNSFVCSGCVKNENLILKQDKYRLCFKNDATDEMSDNDLQDLTSLVAVIGAALALDSIRKVNNGIVEIPVENKD